MRRWALGLCRFPAGSSAGWGLAYWLNAAAFVFNLAVVIGYGDPWNLIYLPFGAYYIRYCWLGRRRALREEQAARDERYP